MGHHIHTITILVGITCWLNACSTPSVYPTAEVYILDGLVVEYGAETPCYGAEGISAHADRCAQTGLVEFLYRSYPVVQVQLAPFAFDQHEVTNAQFRYCVSEGACERPFSRTRSSKG